MKMKQVAANIAVVFVAVVVGTLLCELGARLVLNPADYLSVTWQSDPVLGMTMLVALVAVVILTTPNRWGVAIALHYVSRVYWPDPADPLPSPDATGPRP